MSTSIEVLSHGSLGQLLNKSLFESCALGIASASVTQAGLNSIALALESALEQNHKVTFMHGADCVVTEPAVLRRLSIWSRQYPELVYRVRFNNPFEGAPPSNCNLYWAERDSGVNTCLLGSSSLTEAGLTQNVEINAVLRGPTESQPIRGFRKAFDDLMEDDGLFLPTDRFVTLYEEIHLRELRHKNQRRYDHTLAELYNCLKEEMKSNALQPDTTWQPRTQLDLVVLTLQRAGPGAELHIKDIREGALSAAFEFNLQFKWDTWENSIRGCLNGHTLGKLSGRKLFERVGGEDSRSGVYRLSLRGIEYSGK